MLILILTGLVLVLAVAAAAAVDTRLSGLRVSADKMADSTQHV